MIVFLYHPEGVTRLDETCRMGRTRVVRRTEMDIHHAEIFAQFSVEPIEDVTVAVPIADDQALGFLQWPRRS